MAGELVIYDVDEILITSVTPNNVITGNTYSLRLIINDEDANIIEIVLGSENKAVLEKLIKE